MGGRGFSAASFSIRHLQKADDDKVSLTADFRPQNLWNISLGGPNAVPALRGGIHVSNHGKDGLAETPYQGIAVC